MWKALSINGKQTKEAYINNKLVYTSYPDSKSAINETVYSTLSASTVATTLTHNGTTYDVYGTFTNKRWTAASAGNVRPWFITPHLMVGAHHYPNKVTGNLKIDDSLTVNRLRWVNLKEWALNNGFTEADFPANSFLDDIDMIELDKSTGLPQEECPYLMSKQYVHDNFIDHTLDNVLGYSQSQATNYAIPIMFYENSLVTIRSNWDNASQRVDQLGEPYASCPALSSTQYPRYEGDSGKPKYIRIDGKDVVISQCYGVNTGPDFCVALPMLSAYATMYGDTINALS